MMSAKLLKHRKEGEKGRFYEVTEEYYNRIIAFYGRTVKWVLKHQTATLLVTFGTLVLTLVLIRNRAEGIFPGAGHGSDSRCFGSPRLRFIRRAWRNGSRNWRRSFCRIRRWRACHPSSASMERTRRRIEGRIQINLKPRDERSDDASAIIRRLQPQLKRCRVSRSTCSRCRI